MKASKIKAGITGGQYDGVLTGLYGEERTAAQRERWTKAADEFISIYGDMDGAAVFSVPGRSEISGNHTDHNHGRVLAASIDLDIVAVAAPTDKCGIRVKSAG